MGKNFKYLARTVGMTVSSEWTSGVSDIRDIGVVIIGIYIQFK